MSVQFAAGTKSEISKTLGDIQVELSKRGVTDFGYMTSDDATGFAFRRSGVPFKFVLSMPTEADIPRLSQQARERRANSSDRDRLLNDEAKRRWRCLLLIVKAKLVAVDEGIVEFNDEFLAYAVLGDGRTAGEYFAEAVERSALSGKPLALALPGGSR